MKEIEQFQNCTTFPELKPIPTQELTKWLEKFISNETAIDKLLRKIKKEEKENLDMSFVEDSLNSILKEKESLAKV